MFGAGDKRTGLGGQIQGMREKESLGKVPCFWLRDQWATSELGIWEQDWAWGEVMYSFTC